MAETRHLSPNPSTSESSESFVPSKLRAGMVNYQDPHTIARDFSAYAFPSR